LLVSPAQISKEPGTVGCGLGLTVIVDTVVELPKQLLAKGVTEIVPEMGLENALVAVKEGTLPAPESCNPMSELELIQEEKVVPATGPEKTIGIVVSPAQTV
jgi:hypothetical protein